MNSPLVDKSLNVDVTHRIVLIKMMARRVVPDM
jgi:hypothetical protein